MSSCHSRESFVALPGGGSSLKYSGTDIQSENIQFFQILRVFRFSGTHIQSSQSDTCPVSLPSNLVSKRTSCKDTRVKQGGD